ncbi:hypothetical protein [Spirosoma fluminis]
MRTASSFICTQGVGTNEVPIPDVAPISGQVAFRNHEGGHVNSLD